MQDWGLTEEQHQGFAVLQRFRNNVAAVHGTERVVVLQQSSWAALSLLMATHLEAFDVRFVQSQAMHRCCCCAWSLLFACCVASELDGRANSQQHHGRQPTYAAAVAKCFDGCSSPMYCISCLDLELKVRGLQVIYIDGSHHPQDVLTDAVMAWKLLKTEGILILDGM